MKEIRPGAGRCCAPFQISRFPRFRGQRTFFNSENGPDLPRNIRSWAGSGTGLDNVVLLIKQVSVLAVRAKTCQNLLNLLNRLNLNRLNLLNSLNLMNLLGFAEFAKFDIFADFTKFTKIV